MTKQELIKYLAGWNYTEEECIEGFKYCEDKDIDIGDLEPWQFEDYVIKANGITY